MNKFLTSKDWFSIEAAASLMIHGRIIKGDAWHNDLNVQAAYKKIYLVVRSIYFTKDIEPRIWDNFDPHRLRPLFISADKVTNDYLCFHPVIIDPNMSQVFINVSGLGITAWLKHLGINDKYFNPDPEEAKLEMPAEPAQEPSAIQADTPTEPAMKQATEVNKVNWADLTPDKIEELFHEWPVQKQAHVNNPTLSIMTSPERICHHLLYVRYVPVSKIAHIIGCSDSNIKKFKKNIADCEDSKSKLAIGRKRRLKQNIKVP